MSESPLERDPVLRIALDLTASLASEDRYRRLLAAVRQVIPADAVCLLRLDGEALVPVASHGLTPEALVRRYRLADNPRLAAICGSREPVRFPTDSTLPDPFDGMLEADPSALGHVHGCLGCALHVEGELVGALTADALEPHILDAVDARLLSFLGALAGAAMRTTRLIDALELSAARHGQVARDLMRDVQQRRGHELVGRSASIAKLKRDIELVAATDYPVLITGETGVGKEVVARALHDASRRSREPLIYVNCAALPESVAESELFGHVRGAFTGAEVDRPGKFEVAEGGTLLLDEIGELPPSIQPKLLRALQEGEIQRVGTDRPRKVDVRIIASTNRQMEAELAAGRFRSDLYHRLAVYPVHVPPLRERDQDIALLAAYFADGERRRLGLAPVRLDLDARRTLERYPWPGNVRELHNVVSRAILRASATLPAGEPVILRPEHLGMEFAPREPSRSPPIEPAPSALDDDVPLREQVAEFQRRRIATAVARSGNNWAAAARRLGMHRSNLHALSKRLGIPTGSSATPDDTSRRSTRPVTDGKSDT